MWDVRCDNIFQELNKKLTKTPVLIFPDAKESFLVYCYHLKMGLGGVLMHNRQVIAYALR